MNTKQIFSIRIEVRKDGKIIQDNEGFKHPSLNFHAEINPSKMENELKGYYHTLKAYMPEMSINIYAMTFNSISSTWYNDFGYYGNEDRFLEFT